MKSSEQGQHWLTYKCHWQHLPSNVKVEISNGSATKEWNHPTTGWLQLDTKCLLNFRAPSRLEEIIVCLVGMKHGHKAKLLSGFMVMWDCPTATAEIQAPRSTAPFANPFRRGIVCHSLAENFESTFPCLNKQTWKNEI